MLIELLFVAIAQIGHPTTGSFDRNEIGNLRRATSLTPGEATVLVAADLHPLPWMTRKAIPEAVSAEIAATVQKVNWGKEVLGAPAFAAYLSDIESQPEPKLFSRRDLCPAVGLICSAWDWHLGRPQVVHSWSCLGCCDRTAALTQGRIDSIFADSYRSENWPWRGSKEAPALGKICLPGRVGNVVGMTSAGYVEVWRTIARHGPW